MSRLEIIEKAVRKLLEPSNQPFWTPAPQPEPLDPALTEFLPQLAKGHWQSELTLALALCRNPVLRQGYIRAALAKSGLLELLDQLAISASAEWSGLRLRLLVSAWRADPTHLPPLSLKDRITKSLEAALAYLNPMVRLPFEAWEVPRLSQSTDVGAGIVFPAGIIAEALLVAQQNPEPLVQAIIQQWNPNGWSYWNPKFLPPDSDTLGQVLQVLVPTLSQDELDQLTLVPVNSAFKQIRPNGSVPTMLADGVTWSRQTADKIWPVQECPVVIANFFTGLYMLDPNKYATVIEKGAGWLLKSQKITGNFEGPSYTPPYGRYVACKFLAQILEKMPLNFAKEIKVVLNGEAGAILAEQNWDGSWGTPQATALNVSTLLTLGKRGTPVDAAVLYLTETQQVTGCWRSEPTWLTPGPGVYPAVYYESVPVTTALCLRALAQWEAVNNDSQDGSILKRKEGNQCVQN